MAILNGGERWECNDKTNCNEIEQLVFKDDEYPWIRVDKKRWQKKFNVRDNDLIPVPSQVLYSDLAMEITELKSNRKSRWTIQTMHKLLPCKERSFVLSKTR